MSQTHAVHYALLRAPNQALPSLFLAPSAAELEEQLVAYVDDAWATDAAFTGVRVTRDQYATLHEYIAAWCEDNKHRLSFGFRTLTFPTES